MPLIKSIAYDKNFIYNPCLHSYLILFIFPLQAINTYPEHYSQSSNIGSIYSLISSILPLTFGTKREAIETTIFFFVLT